MRSEKGLADANWIGRHSRKKPHVYAIFSFSKKHTFCLNVYRYLSPPNEPLGLFPHILNRTLTPGQIPDMHVLTWRPWFQRWTVNTVASMVCHCRTISCPINSRRILPLRIRRTPSLLFYSVRLESMRSCFQATPEPTSFANLFIMAFRPNLHGRPLLPSLCVVLIGYYRLLAVNDLTSVSSENTAQVQSRLLWLCRDRRDCVKAIQQTLYRLKTRPQHSFTESAHNSSYF